MAAARDLPDPPQRRAGRHRRRPLHLPALTQLVPAAILAASRPDLPPERWRTSVEQGFDGVGGAADGGAAVVGHEDRALDEDRVGDEQLDPRRPVVRPSTSGRARRPPASPMRVISQGSLPMAVSTASSSAAVGAVVEVAPLVVGDASLVEQLLGLAGLRASGVVPQLHGADCLLATTTVPSWRRRGPEPSPSASPSWARRAPGRRPSRAARATSVDARGDAPRSGSTAAPARSPPCSSHCELADLDALVVTHEHPDHCIELPVLRNAMVLRPRRRAAAALRAREACSPCSRPLVGSRGITPELRAEDGRRPVGGAGRRPEAAVQPHRPPGRDPRRAGRARRPARRRPSSTASDTGPGWSVGRLRRGHRHRRRRGHLPRRRRRRVRRPCTAPRPSPAPTPAPPASSASSSPTSPHRRPRGPPGRGRGRLRRRRSHVARPHERYELRMTHAETTAARLDELRPITFERDFTEMADGSVLVSLRPHPRAVHGVGRRGRAPLDAGHGQGLGHRRVLDAARARRPSGSAGRSRTASRRAAPRRSSGSSAGRCGRSSTWPPSASARSSSTATSSRPTAAPARRRSAAGGSRCTTPAPASSPPAGSPPTRWSSRAPRSPSASSAARPCSTCPTSRTPAPRST